MIYTGKDLTTVSVVTQLSRIEPDEWEAFLHHWLIDRRHYPERSFHTGVKIFLEREKGKFQRIAQIAHSLLSAMAERGKLRKHDLDVLAGLIGDSRSDHYKEPFYSGPEDEEGYIDPAFLFRRDNSPTLHAPIRIALIDFLTELDIFVMDTAQGKAQAGICKECGKPYRANPARKQEYCSEICSTKSRVRQHRERKTGLVTGKR